MKEVVLNRIAKLRELMKREGADAFVVITDEGTNWQSLYYLSGFRGTAGALVVYHDGVKLLLDNRYVKQGSEQSPHEVARQKDGAAADVIEDLRTRNAKVIYCEASKTYHSTWAQLAEYKGEWRDGSECLRTLRRTKGGREIGFIRKACDIASEAFLDSLNHVKAGITELEYQALLNYKINNLGGETASGMIVASGVRSALPHGRATDKPIMGGEWVTVDFSALWRGYFSDITRNFSMGEPEGKAMEYHELLCDAHRQAAAMLRPGVLGRDVHNGAVAVLERSGIAEYFTHGLGHGLGIEIHEAPSLSAKKNDVLAEGDVVTVEPGVYIDGWGGLRVEDDYVITSDGAERLTDKLNQCFCLA